MFLVVKGGEAFTTIMTISIYSFEVNTSGIAAVMKASSWRLSKLGLHSRFLEDMGLEHGRLCRAAKASHLTSLWSHMYLHSLKFFLTFPYDIC